MKKKLLTILVSIFVVMATFTVNVFADEPKNIKQLFNTYPSDFPVAIDSNVPDNAWISSNNICYISQNNNLCFKNESWVSSVPGDFEVSRIDDTNNFKCNSVNIIFNIENDKLISIERNYTDSTSSLNGTYTAKVTIGDILSTNPNFPNSESKAWKNDNGQKAYISDGVLKIGSGEVDLNSVVSKIADDTYYNNAAYHDLYFNLDQSGKLISIVLTLSMNSDNGTYVPPTTIADILPNDFPKSSKTGWVSEHGYKIYKDEDLTDIVHLATSVNLSTPLIKGENKYTFVNGDTTYTFNMSSGVLTSIQIEGFSYFPPANPNGTFSPYRFINSVISIQEGSTEDIEFITNAKYIDQATTPVSVKIDDETLDTEKYTVTNGSTYVTLKGAYVSGLEVGTHRITISVTGTGNNEYADISQEFTITAATAPSSNPTPIYEIPNTGVDAMSTNNHSILKFSSLSLLIINTYLTIKKKKDK